ncbi:GIY-YIG nuclease family protein [Arachidicoccus soli]|uniref:GIY-YIG nuclease family protein n=1 Tax=Arachidicoccus soli TaxID=2341117 RepID=A0A386HLH4_9BACT|nr:GIY-YIG nuclease family protein [Arachidicoccus soli]AYD46512.1 GIY-YIG nuclease family protein [Arachidicoccus soli]
MENKKEIKQAYKELKLPKGVFQLKNMVNNKRFIGTSTSLYTVWNSHRFQLNNGTHPFKELQTDWNNLGEGNFVFEIVEILKDEELLNHKQELKVLEEMVLEEFRKQNIQFYNKK